MRLLLHIATAAALFLPRALLAQNPPSPELTLLTPAPIVLTLSDAVKRGLANSPGLEAAEFEREVVEGKLAEARGAYILPEVRLRAFGGPVPNVPNGLGPEANFPSDNTRFSDLGPFFQARIEAVQPIFTFGKLSGLKEAASRGVEAKRNQEAVVRNELIDRIKKVYAAVVYLYSLKDFLDELKDRTDKARDRVEEQIQRNSADVTDIDRMRLAVFTAETDRRLIELRNGIKLGLDTLGILTGYPPGTPLDIADKMVKFKNIDLQPVDYYLGRASISRPEIRQLGDAVAIRKALMKSSRADYFPSFFLAGFYGYGRAPGRQHVDNPFLVDSFNFNSGGVTFGLEQKLSFHMTHARQDQANAEYHVALGQQKMALQGIEIQIRKVHSDVLSKRDAVKSAETAFKAGRSWVLASTLNFGVGLTPVKDLLEAFVGYSHVKGGYLDIIHEYDVSLAELSKVVGEEVTDLRY